MDGNPGRETGGEGSRGRLLKSDTLYRKTSLHEK